MPKVSLSVKRNYANKAQELDVYAVNGTVKIVSLQARELRSAWPAPETTQRCRGDGKRAVDFPLNSC
jgi:hypothetical protein